MSYKKKENPPKRQKPASAPRSSNTENKTTNDSRPKPNQICSGCGYYYFPHQLHTCPSCGKQLCDDCYPKHNCKKQGVVPPPNPHIAVDQQEWYNKQPTPCDNCGKIVRADALRKIDDKKLCPDCLLEYASSTRKRDNAIILIVIGAIALVVLWILFYLHG